MAGIITNQETVEALKELSVKKNGVLKPLDVVDAARPEDSPIHKYFEWDDSKAAEAYRIEQARGLLQRVYVNIIRPDGKEGKCQVFVSLTTDREEGGYRQMVSVLSDTEMRNQLVRDALADMQAFTQRYDEIRELAQVHSAMKRARVKLLK